MNVKYFVGDAGTPFFKLWGHSFGTFSSDPLAPLTIEEARALLAAHQSPSAALYAVVPDELLQEVLAVVSAALAAAEESDELLRSGRLTQPSPCWLALFLNLVWLANTVGVAVTSQEDGSG